MDQGFQDHLCRPTRAPALVLGRARELGWRWDERRAQHQELPYLTAPEITRAAISWLEEHGDTPFFLFLNYLDVHMPNAAPGSQGLPFEDEDAILGKKDELQWFPRYLTTGAMTAAQQRSFVNEYDRELIYLDRWLGVLFDHLDRSGLSKSTLVVLTSDHGESLGEHQIVGHKWDLHAPEVDVPLIVWEPGASPGRAHGQRRAWTCSRRSCVISAFRYRRRPRASRCSRWTTRRSPSCRTRFTRCFRPPSLRASTACCARYASASTATSSSTGEERLFHRPADPGETHNLIAERPDLAASGRAALEAWLRGTPEAQPPTKAPDKMDPETLENLRALGYVR